MISTSFCPDVLFILSEGARARFLPTPYHVREGKPRRETGGKKFTN
jgi:hypothetical protein